MRIYLTGQGSIARKWHRHKAEQEAGVWWEMWSGVSLTQGDCDVGSKKAAFD